MPESMNTSTKSFISDFDKAHRLNGPQWVQDIRRHAESQFAALDLPHRKMETWRFTNVAPILRTSFDPVTEATNHNLTSEDVAPFLFPSCGWIELVFVDGFFAKELSTPQQSLKGITAESLLSALQSHPEDLEPHLDRYLVKDDVFCALNSAFLRDGAYVFIDKDVTAKHPIHLLFLTTGQSEGRALFPRNLVVAESGSQGIVVESHVGLNDDGAYLNNAATEIILGEGARLTYYKVIREGARGYHMASTKITQKKDSKLESFALSLDGAITRNELCVLFDDAGCECDLFGLSLNSGERLIDNPLTIDHAHPHCRSRITYKNVLDDKCHTVFTGKVFARRDAQKTDSDQINNSLLLSDGATVDTKPQLEIYADDVKCTHGATIGAAPEEIIFYFRARGIDEAMARGILTYGFASEIVDEISLEPLRDRLGQIVFDKYSPE